MKYLILLLAFANTACAQRTPIVPDYEIGEELIILEDTTSSFPLSKRLEGLNPSLKDNSNLLVPDPTNIKVNTGIPITSGAWVTSHNEYITKCDTFLTIAVEYTWGPPSWQEQPRVISLIEIRCRQVPSEDYLMFFEYPSSKYYKWDFTPFEETKGKFYMYMSKPIKYD